MFVRLDMAGCPVQPMGDSDGSAQPFATGFMAGSTSATSGELTADQVAVAVWSYER